MLFSDIQTYLAEDILTKVDRMSMAHALEVRSPLLDYRVAEFACRLPAQAKLKGLTTKTVLRGVSQGIVPDSIIRRSKYGFQLPLGEWLRTSLREWAHDQLFPNHTGLVKSGAARRIWDDHQNGRVDNTHKIWLLLSLNQWQDMTRGNTVRTAGHAPNNGPGR
jgi:asparagine synthase (glutamine-hydrolysing)